MKYVTGIFGLNIEDSLEDACGDWHTSGLNWDNLVLYESESSLLGNYGIETNKRIPCHDGLYNVANTIRCVLDLMVGKHTRYLKGFRNDFFCSDVYNEEIFNKVYELRGLDNWNEINALMKREYMFEWDKYIEEKEKKNHV